MKENRLGLLSLIALSVGSMIGTGVFGLPAEMAAEASAGGILIGWLITGVGIIALALVFQTLALEKPNIAGGIYGYARTGFGDFTGFTIGWGYYISAILANVAFYVMLFQALGHFIPVYKEFGHRFTFISASLLAWLIYWLISRGLRDAVIVNMITTVAKLMPIVVFVIIAFVIFKVEHFRLDFWGADGSPTFSNIVDQVKRTMLITMWVFVGVEGVSVLSGRAKHMKDVGKATVIGLLSTLSIYVLVSVLSLGAMPHHELSALGSPSMGELLATIVGPWGATMINVGIIVSLSGALLGWTLISTEIPYVAAQDGLLIRFCKKENKKGTPIGALLLTTLITQGFLILSHLNKATYQAMYLIATAAILIPYLSSAVYALKAIFNGEVLKKFGTKKVQAITCATLAVVYSIWVLYATGSNYMLLVSLLYAAGIPFYLYTKWEQKQRWFQPFELIILTLVIVLAGLAVARILNIGFQAMTG